MTNYFLRDDKNFYYHGRGGFGHFVFCDDLTQARAMKEDEARTIQRAVYQIDGKELFLEPVSYHDDERREDRIVTPVESDLLRAFVYALSVIEKTLDSAMPLGLSSAHGPQTSRPRPPSLGVLPTPP